ncbi:MAG: HAD family hydrolase [Promethearchaeota archaeon]
MSQVQILNAVLFDVDGVIVESELLHLATFNETLASLGITISETDWRHRFVGKGSEFIMKTLFSEHNISEDVKPWINRRRIVYQQHVAKGELKPIPGFLSFYASIIKEKLEICFVSTGHPSNIAAALRTLGLDGKHPVVDVTQVKRIKPDPEAYLLGAKILQVNPINCLVFEDSPIGIAAAKAAGMSCVALTTSNSSDELRAADLIIPNYQNWTIKMILSKLNRDLPETG